MKTIILFLLCTVISYGQVPQGMSHRGTAYNTDGSILQDQDVSLRVRILNGNGGSVVYSENHSIHTNNNGQYNINIGQGSNSNPSVLFSSVDWSNGNKWLEIGIDPNNGTNFTVVGSNQMMSVPYAFYSQSTSSNTTIATVKTVSELKSYINFDPIIGNVTVYVQGYYSPSDGGGGFFLFKKFSDMSGIAPINFPQNDDGIYIDSYNGNYSSVGIWIRQFSGDIDVRFYGARGGLGNCTNEFQKAINAAAKQFSYGNKSSTVYIPNDIYTINKLILKDGVTLKGESKTHTTIKSNDDDELGLFVKEPGILRDIHILNLNLVGNASSYSSFPNRRKGCFIFDSEGQNIGGLWFSTFKNLRISEFMGNSMYFSSGVSGGFQSVNQFVTMEAVNIESVGQIKKINSSFNNNSHALELRGSNGQFLFNNCTFDGGSYLLGTGTMPEYKVNGIPVYIGPIPNSLLNPAMITFNTCSIQNGQEGLWIESSNNINLTSCWFEFFERAIVVKGQYRISKAINVSNCSFLNSAGRYGSLPSNTGSVIISTNSKINVENNYIVNSWGTGDSINAINDPVDEKFKFITLDPNPSNNFGVNTSGNFFEDTRNNFDAKSLSQTTGIMGVYDLTSNTSGIIDIEGNKTVYFRNTGLIKTISQIKSHNTTGELIFIRADKGSIRFNELGNIYLGNMKDPSIVTNPPNGQLTLNNGGEALFVKSEDITLNTSGQTIYSEKYTLISYKLKQ